MLKFLNFRAKVYTIQKSILTVSQNILTKLRLLSNFLNNLNFQMKMRKRVQISFLSQKCRLKTTFQKTFLFFSEIDGFKSVSGKYMYFNQL